MTFNPQTDVPTTEKEVIIALQRDDELLTKLLQGLYRVLRKQGKGLLEAYRETLETHVRGLDYDIPSDPPQPEQLELEENHGQRNVG